MIIDQLPATTVDNLTDELPVEQGQLTFKTTWQKIKELLLGTTALPTTAQTVTGAIAEIDSDLDDKAEKDASNITASDWRTALGVKASDFTIYDSVTDLGLTSGSATINGVWTSLPSNSIIIFNSTELASAERPSSSAIIEVVRLTSARGWIKSYDKYDTGGDYRMFLDSSNVPTGTWETVADAVTSGTVTPAQGMGTLNASDLKKYGRLVCFSLVQESVPTITNSWTTIATIPSGYRPTATNSFLGMISNTAVQVSVYTSGNVQARATSSGVSGTFRCAASWIV